MKKLLFCITLGLLVLATSATSAWGTRADPVSPTVTGIDPAAAANDLDTVVTITGTGFALDVATGTIPPAVTLGSTPLTDVTFVDPTMLTATVPFGMDTGPYALTITNPDGGLGSLPGAFVVQPGIGHWNGGDLYGGEVRQILMKPGDPRTLYAPAYRIDGLFRSTDAGDHWTYAGADLSLGNGVLAVDPLHPGWLYACTWKGLQRSKDDGDSWTTIMQNTWPDGSAAAPTEVFPSPYHSGVLFITAHDDWGFPASGSALGLIKSTNGAPWKVVKDLEGVSIVNLAFDPADHQQLALLTSDARVFRSTDGGETWSEAGKPPLSAVGIRGKIAYNPYTVGEVWIASATPAGICKSTDGGDSWNDVSGTNGLGGWDLAFTGPLDVWTTGNHSTDGGASWGVFGTIYGGGQLTFDPGDHQIAYLGDSDYGVQKTTDGGATWEVKNHGLAGLSCSSMDVSTADPLRVYAAMGSLPGVHRSVDGGSDWDFSSLPIMNGVFAVRDDPTDAQRVYAASGDGFCRSTDGGDTWDNLGWNLSPALSDALGWVMEPDPFQPGHVLVGLDTGMYLTGPGYLYESGDYGVSWHQVAMPEALKLINDIAFDPVTPGLVYLTTNGAGVYRSADSGGTWARIDDPQKQPGLLSTGYETPIAIATHPQHMVTVGGSDGHLYRSVDKGGTWQRAEGGEYPGADMFVDGDSTRLYRGTGEGLFFSKDAGDSWTRAAGAFGHLQIMAVDYADMDGHAIIYAATNGGQAGTSASATRSRRARAVASAPVAAGIYRYVVVTPKVTLKLSGLSGGALRLGRRLAAKGLLTPGALAGSKVSLTVQRRQNGTWRKVKTVLCTAGAGGAFSWAYRPAKRGAYRVQATLAKTATHMAATTQWRTFKVK